MRDTEAVAIEEVQAEAPICSDLADGEVIDPDCASLICQKPERAEERAAYYATPAFRQRLLEHLHQAKQKALADQ